MRPAHLPRLLAAASAATLILACTACSSNQELYSQLSERQANEMVAVDRSPGVAVPRAM